MSKYPIYLELQDKQAVVVGAGTVAARKAQALAAAGANVTVVAPTIELAFEQSCKELPIEVIQDCYSKDYIQDAFLVIAATNDKTLNEEIYNNCQKLNILCNVADVPDLCNFYVPAVIGRGNLQIAIGTNGKCPAYAAHLRQTFEKLVTEDHGRFLDALEQVRQSVIERIPESNRKELLSKLSADDSFGYFLENGVDAWKRMAQEQITGKK